MECDPKLIQRLKSVSNLVSRIVDFWVDSILEGYVTEIAIDIITSYSDVEQKQFQRPHKIYLSSLKRWIKILVCEK